MTVNSPPYIFYRDTHQEFKLGEWTFVMFLSMNLCLKMNVNELLWTHILCICIGPTIRYPQGGGFFIMKLIKRKHHLPYTLYSTQRSIKKATACYYWMIEKASRDWPYTLKTKVVLKIQKWYLSLSRILNHFWYFQKP